MVAPEPAPASASFTIRRAHGAVVMTVHGDVDQRASVILERALSDLIEGQGNLRVLVDLTQARVRDGRASLFSVSAEQARRHKAELAVLHREEAAGTPA